jgi:3-isopropylmalate/(R)-2-methylmalate dehydratase large subunit
VRKLPNGQTQLFVGLHLIHEVTTPQAFYMMRARGWQVLFPDRTIATVDHIVPTRDQRRPFLDVMAEDMFAALERNCREAAVRLFDMSTGSQGIVHVIDPEMGLTQPGMTIACGDSHTSTHGALGAVALASARRRCATCSRLVPRVGSAPRAAHPSARKNWRAVSMRRMSSSRSFAGWA